ncbi:cytokinin riboside 5 -monophosphate phosphoribohydrolase LOGL2 [Lentinula edodes]|uniref:Cytokinin riboside 5-monophosphate phosphoribohydrolase LOGL2 n=1 Tax=Lentinula edodes TaxID=5353 RepID=A0A1Q3E9K1_LENED|nr:uncharacterized protein C8R40DRAFT_727413 [Lentinula edodes]KAH7869616.1 hypothetical protein C8R40DRAFT_727413 [Lentinula edodes]GAW03888.1 cytokinin riboside 5 -monophosphate phosphoribohydrolase LOGL2 [Lentinula edodes]
MNSEERIRAVAVYCGSSIGKRAAYAKAAHSVGVALAKSNRPLIYGGGTLGHGLMGTVAHAVVEAGGKVTGVTPYALVAAGGEEDKSIEPNGIKRQVALPTSSSNNIETIIVNSMHERKVEMAKRACGFVALPGGFGTFEEFFEVTTWTQIGIHDKPVVLLNVLNYYEPIRKMIQSAIEEGFVQSFSSRLITIVDGPEDLVQHETFDWGFAALQAIESWKEGEVLSNYDWTKRIDGTRADGSLAAS